MTKDTQPATEKTSTGESEPAHAPGADIFAPQSNSGAKAASYRPRGKGGKLGDSSAPSQRPAQAEKASTTEKAGTAAPTPVSHSQALAETVVGSFVERLKAEAKRKGGTLTIEDLEALNKEFEKKTQALQAVFEKSFEEYVRAQDRARAEREYTRQDPFERLMVHRFSHLFAEGDPLLKEDALLKEDDAVSRRILPGFFMAIEMMLDADSIARYRDTCARIVERVTGGRDDDASWDRVYADKEANAVALDAQVAIALHFQDLKKRSAWLVNLVNGNLSPPDSAAGEAGDVAAWQFTEGACRRVLDALLSDLKRALSTDEGRRALGEHHGAEACAALAEVMNTLGAGGS